MRGNKLENYFTKCIITQYFGAVKLIWIVVICYLQSIVGTKCLIFNRFNV